MHVLFLNSWYPNKNAPTLGNFVKKHAEAAALYNKVSCLSIFPSKDISSMESVVNNENGLLDVTIYYPSVKLKIPGIHQWLKLKNYQKAFNKGLEIIESNRGKIDITHLNVIYPLGLFALKLKQLRKIPFVVTEHSTAYHDAEHSFTSRQLKLTKQVLKEAAMILPVSNDLGKAIAKLAPSTPQRRITNVVDSKKFVIGENNRTTFLHISTLNENQKNPRGIIDVLAALKNEGLEFNMKFISDFPFAHLQHYALEKGLNKEHLQFVGPLETAEVANELKDAKALVLFSNYENFPCVIAEAFMSGVPIISTSVNGIPEYVNETNGILISPKNNEELKSAFLFFIENKQQYDQKELREFALENFSYEAIGKEFSHVYNEVLKNVG